LEEIPEGFNATEPVYPAGTPTVPDTPRITTGDDGPNTPYVSTSGRTGSGISSGGMGDKLSGGLLMGVNTDYEDMTLKQLQDAENELDNRASNSNTIGLVTSMLMKSNPVTAVISLITTGTKIAAERKKKDIAKAAVKKYGELKVEEEKNFPELSTKRLSDDYKKLEDNLRAYKNIYNEALGFGQVKTSVLNRAINTFTGREGDSLFSGQGKEGVPNIDDIWRDALSGPQAPTDPAADMTDVLSTRESKPNVQAQVADVQEKTAKGKSIRFAAAEAARKSQERFAAQQRQQQRNLGYDISGKSDGGEGYLSSVANKPGYTRRGNTVYAPGGGAVAGLTDAGGTWGTGAEYAKAQQDKTQANEDRYEQQRSDFFGGLFNDGGLVAKPAMKQKNKKTTQRRKGLGTRP